MTRLGLLSVGVGSALGLRSLLARLTTGSGDPDQTANFAERAWSSRGPRVAAPCIIAGLIITLIGAFL